MDDSQYKQLLADAKDYSITQINLLKLSLLEKLSKIIGLLLVGLVVVLLAFAALAYAGLALAFLLAHWIPLWASCLIMGGVFLLFMLLAIIFRKPLFVYPMVAVISAILFSSDNHDQAVK